MIVKENQWAFVHFPKSYQEKGFVNREIHSIFSDGMVINSVNPGYQPFSCFPVVTASFWVCQRHRYSIPATLQTVCKALQCFRRKALQVSLHRCKSTLGTVLFTFVASQPITTHAHVFAILVHPSPSKSWQDKMSFPFVPWQPHFCYTRCSLDVLADVF